MPFNDCELSPAETMYKRKVRNLIPNFNSKITDQSNLHELLKKRQAQQKMYYDRHSRPLKEFQAGDKVKVHFEDHRKPHENGLVLGCDNNPRSYKVETERGTVIKRNRRDLTKGVKFDKERFDFDDVPIEANENNVIRENEPIPNTIVIEKANIANEPITPNIATRSGRVINKPAWLKDYVCVIK